jgi:hypothetical protein
VQAMELICNVYGADYLPYRATLIEDQGLRPRCPRPGTKRRYWTCMKLITPTHSYTIHSSGSQVAPIVAEECVEGIAMCRREWTRPRSTMTCACGSTIGHRSRLSYG